MSETGLVVQESRLARWRRHWLVYPLVLFAVGFVANATMEALARTTGLAQGAWLHGFVAGLAVMAAYQWLRQHWKAA